MGSKIGLPGRDRQVQHLPIVSLHRYERNSRTHTDAQITQIIASLQEFGWTNPVLVDEHNAIIAGHARVEAAKKLGLAEVPCIVIADLTDAQKRAYVIADNKLALNAGWDEELLALELSELRDINFDLGLTGFSAKEIEELLAPPDEDEAEEHGPAPGIIKAATLDELAPSDDERAAIEGRKILIEFSGGKDSSATAIWARHFFPEAEVELCYVDMGADFIGYHIFLHRYAEAAGLALKILQSSRNIIDLLFEKGWPRFIGPWCHTFLHGALDAHFEAHGADKVVIMRGGRAQEKARVGKKNKTRFLTIDRMKDYTFFQPMYFAAKDVGAKILEQSGLPMWDGYRYGLQRTACRVCPGQNQVANAAIRANFPDVWAELMYLEDKLGPGCWQDPVSQSGRGSFVDLADRGQAKFESGGYLTRDGR